MKVRKGKIKDFEKLNQEWAWGDALWQRKEQKNYIERMQKGMQEFLVLEDGDEILGELHIYWESEEDYDEANGKDRAYLSAMRIHPDYRGQGLGTQLIKKAFERIRQNGFKEIAIGAYVSEPRTRDWYNKLGFTEFIKEDFEENEEGRFPYNLYLKKL